ncbi:MAG: TIGR04282 family arsenosugar biosynthesis glycosyltransferase [Hyphomicrobiaceae bacterium]|nr:TIGR04282 family arsenosugar biosynthesis glycosyltransferase [Hyphomicrobiaceae bacterium]
MTDTSKAGPARQNWLVVMAKEPRCGAVKSRLAKDIGSVAATAFYRNALRNVTARLVRDPRWNTLIAVTPDTAVAAPVWPSAFGYVCQGSGDLGARMQGLFDTLPPGPVVFIGTDIPEITAAHVANAFTALGSNDAVIGPGDDGGYWLIGLRRTPKIPRAFEGVRWSSPHTLDDTLANLRHSRVAMLDQLTDVDDGRSYHRLGTASARRILPLATGIRT